MNFKSVYRVVTRYFAGLLCLTTLYAGALVYLWDKNEDIQKKYTELYQAQQSFNHEKVEFERHKAEELEAHFRREMELQKRELIADQDAKKNADAETSIKDREVKYLELTNKLDSEQQKLGESAARQAAEQKLQSLMSEFAAFGVNLNSKPCGDAEALRKYNAAKVKFDEIYSWAEAHSLEDKYRNFLFHNQQSVLRFCGDS